MSKLKRPLPPKSFIERAVGDAMFMPAPDVFDWIRLAILEESAPLYNEDHKHLEHASIGVLWAAAGYSKQMRQVIGTAEQTMFRESGWQRWRKEEQLHAWFGLQTPDFIITLDAQFCAACSDIEWCALVEHELYHIGHARDEFGQPAFFKDGRPKLAMRGHDVEEFVGVVRRYGAVSCAVAQMVEAAKAKPRIAGFTAGYACGTCIERAA